MSATRDGAAAHNVTDQWARVTSDGTTLTVKLQSGLTEPTEGSWASVSAALTSTDADLNFDGGRLGFGRGFKGQIDADSLTVRTDNNADGTYETTQLIEDFTLDSSGYAHETLTHDAAGNLTYDGVYAYAYDAWNRLVTVTKASRRPGPAISWSRRP